MKLLYLINFAGGSGTEKYVRLLMENYRQQGHTCILVYSQGGPLSLWAGKNDFATWQLNMDRRHAAAAGIKLAGYCRENSVELIHAQYPRENLIALMAKKIAGTPVVFTGHLTIRQGFFWQRINRLLSPADNAVIAVCAAAKKTMAQNGIPPEKITVIPNGTDVPQQHRIERRDKTIRFITLARLAPEKGLETLVEACGMLRNQCKVPFCCHIFGEGELSDLLQRQIEEKNLENVVQCPGKTPEPLEELRKSDVFVSPSLNNEALSFAALEAMSLGLPLVMTDVGAGRELTEQCGTLVPPGDAPALCQAMRRLAESEALRCEYGERAIQNAAKKYSLKNMLTKTMDLYLSACNQKEKRV